MNRIGFFEFLQASDVPVPFLCCRFPPLNLTNLNSSIFDIYIVIWLLLLEAFD